MNRFLAYLFFAILLPPFVSQANTNEQQVIIDKIIQHQTQWKKNFEAQQSSSDSFISSKIVGGSTTLRGQHPEFALVIFTNSLGDIIMTIATPKPLLKIDHEVVDKTV